MQPAYWHAVGSVILNRIIWYGVPALITWLLVTVYFKINDSGEEKRLKDAFDHPNQPLDLTNKTLNPEYNISSDDIFKEATTSMEKAVAPLEKIDDKVTTEIPTETTSKDLHELICTKCYEINKPIIIQQGSWPVFIFVFIIMVLLITIPSLLWLIWLAIIGLLSGFSAFDGLSSFNPFPMARFLPEAPSIVNECRNCHAVDHMVEIDSKLGNDAIYWHQRKQQGGDFTSANKQGKLS